VSGLGTATFTIPTTDTDNQPLSRVGTGDPNQNLAILFEDNPAFATYDLSTSIGPLSGPPAFNSGAHFATTSGDFVLDTISGNVTFQAQVAPEPSGLALAGVGLAGLLGYGWRRRKPAVG
jgi:MYXO-CTERM domain-containing protein